MKRAWSMALAVSLSLALSLPVAYASSAVQEPDPPKAEVCEACEVGSRVLGTPTYSSSKDVGVVPCGKYRDRLDVTRERFVYTPVTCTDCDFYEQVRGTQSYTYCSH